MGTETEYLKISDIGEGVAVNSLLPGEQHFRDILSAMEKYILLKVFLCAK